MLQHLPTGSSSPPPPRPAKTKRNGNKKIPTLYTGTLPLNGFQLDFVEKATCFKWSKNLSNGAPGKTRTWPIEGIDVLASGPRPNFPGPDQSCDLSSQLLAGLEKANQLTRAGLKQFELIDMNAGHSTHESCDSLQLCP